MSPAGRWDVPEGGLLGVVNKAGTLATRFARLVWRRGRQVRAAARASVGVHLAAVSLPLVLLVSGGAAVEYLWAQGRDVEQAQIVAQTVTRDGDRYHCRQGVTTFRVLRSRSGYPDTFRSRDDCLPLSGGVGHRLAVVRADARDPTDVRADPLWQRHSVVDVLIWGNLAALALAAGLTGLARRRWRRAPSVGHPRRPR